MRSCGPSLNPCEIAQTLELLPLPVIMRPQQGFLSFILDFLLSIPMKDSYSLQCGYRDTIWARSSQHPDSHSLQYCVHQSLTLKTKWSSQTLRMPASRYSRWMPLVPSRIDIQWQWISITKGHSLFCFKVIQRTEEILDLRVAPHVFRNSLS